MPFHFIILKSPSKCSIRAKGVKSSGIVSFDVKYLTVVSLSL